MEYFQLENFTEVSILVFSLTEYVIFNRGKESCNFIRKVFRKPFIYFDLYDFNIKPGQIFYVQALRKNDIYKKRNVKVSSPRIPAPSEIPRGWWYCRHLPFSQTHVPPRRRKKEINIRGETQRVTLWSLHCYLVPFLKHQWDFWPSLEKTLGINSES